MSEQVPASWNEGPSRRAVLDYVRRVTTPGAGFVEPADRIATFDNDGTLWVEQPMLPQFDLVFRAWQGEVKAVPALAARRPYKALVERDQEFFEGLARQWSIRKLADHLRRNVARPVRIGREALRCLLSRRGITFQRTKTWKESPDPAFDAKLERIDCAVNERPDRTFAFDEFGPLGIRPTAGSCWAEQSRPDRLPATYRRTHGITYFHGCYSVGDDQM